MRVGLIAGEPSGDALGAALIDALRRRVPDLECVGVAGAAMRAAGCEAWAQAEHLAVMGLAEVLVHLPRLLRIRRHLTQRLLADPPQVLVGIDAPDFNLPLERRLRKAGVPTVHYVSPSVWAWRERRIVRIADSVDRMLTLFPFEADVYQRHGVPVTEVGHPLQAQLKPLDQATTRAALGLPVGGPILALLPGSRGSEYRRLAPLFVATAQWLRAQGLTCHLVLPLVDASARTTVEGVLRETGAGLSCTLLDGRSSEAMAAADVVLLASGTATLEALLLERPMVVAYRLAPLTYAIARHLVHTPYVAIPNLLAGHAVVPEFIQHAATPQSLGAAVAALLKPPAAAAMRSQLAALRSPLAGDPADLAAQAVLEVAGWR